MASPTFSARVCATRCTSIPGPPNGRATSSGLRSCGRAGSRRPATRPRPPPGGSASCTISPIGTRPTWPRGSSASERWENARRRRDSRPPHSRPRCGPAATPRMCCPCAVACSTSAGRRWSCRPGAGPPRSSHCWTCAPTPSCGGVCLPCSSTGTARRASPRDDLPDPDPDRVRRGRAGAPRPVRRTRPHGDGGSPHRRVRAARRDAGRGDPHSPDPGPRRDRAPARRPDRCHRGGQPRRGGRRFTLVGGIALDSAYFAGLTPDSELTVAVRLPTDTIPAAPSPDAVVREFSLPFVLERDSSAVLRPARIVVSHSLGSLAALRRGVDVAFLAAVLLAGAIALLLGGWLSLRISRPLTALAHKTAQIDMDRLDVVFESERGDEIGALTRLLGSMTERLRAGATKLREAERRIAMGDLARQVNHDIKNGLTPIRNVFRHFSETAATEPDRLSAVFRERQGTIEASIAYLANLAGNYARLYPAPAHEACDVRHVIREIIGRLGAPGTTDLRADLAEDLPLVCTDQLVLRRILENLVGNAVDSLEGRSGTVTITAAAGAPANGRPSVRITVADTGKGLTRQELDRAFRGPHPTQSGGTGLGLSIVRRFGIRANGVLRGGAPPGAGSRFIVDLPGA